MLTPEAIDLFDRAVLCWLASADAEGHPSVSPKDVFAVRSPRQLVIADIASPRSTHNVRVHSAVCVAAIDVFEQHGYQVYGSARVVGVDEGEFDELSAPLRERAGTRFQVRSVVVVDVERVTRILAPAVWMYPDVPAAERRRAVLSSYGVQDLPAEADGDDPGNREGPR